MAGELQLISGTARSTKRVRGDERDLQQDLHRLTQFDQALDVLLTQGRIEAEYDLEGTRRFRAIQRAGAVGGAA